MLAAPIARIEFAQRRSKIGDHLSISTKRSGPGLIGGLPLTAALGFSRLPKHLRQDRARSDVRKLEFFEVVASEEAAFAKNLDSLAPVESSGDWRRWLREYQMQTTRWSCDLGVRA
jgi:hypothetical protein